MFLDDRLYDHLQNATIDSAEDVQRVYQELLDICNDELKAKVTTSHENLTYKEGFILTERIFKSWDLFAIKALKLNRAWSILKTHTYKKAYLSNPEMKELYLKMKQS
jgi:hypothetical protein